MKMDNVENKVKLIALNMKKDDPKTHTFDESEVTKDADLIVDLDFDSIDVVKFLMAIEEAFNIEIRDEDAVKINTIGDATRLIAKELAEPANTPFDNDFLQTHGDNAARFNLLGLFRDVNKLVSSRELIIPEGTNLTTLVMKDFLFSAIEIETRNVLNQGGMRKHKKLNAAYLTALQFYNSQFDELGRLNSDAPEDEKICNDARGWILRRFSRNVQAAQHTKTAG